MAAARRTLLRLASRGSAPDRGEVVRSRPRAGPSDARRSRAAPPRSSDGRPTSSTARRRALEMERLAGELAVRHGARAEAVARSSSESYDDASRAAGARGARPGAGGRPARDRRLRGLRPETRRHGESYPGRPAPAVVSQSDPPCFSEPMLTLGRAPDNPGSHLAPNLF